MARKLKTYQTSMGFFDLAVAAPSMKAALEAWGSNSNLFHQGVAKESSDGKNHRRGHVKAGRHSQAASRIKGAVQGTCPLAYTPVL
jgi:hypothetical protein